MIKFIFVLSFVFITACSSLPKAPVFIEVDKASLPQDVQQHMARLNAAPKGDYEHSNLKQWQKDGCNLRLEAFEPDVYYFFCGGEADHVILGTEHNVAVSFGEKFGIFIGSITNKHIILTDLTVIDRKTGEIVRRKDPPKPKPVWIPYPTPEERKLLVEARDKLRSQPSVSPGTSVYWQGQDKLIYFSYKTSRNDSGWYEYDYKTQFAKQLRKSKTEWFYFSPTFRDPLRSQMLIQEKWLVTLEEDSRRGPRRWGDLSVYELPEMQLVQRIRLFEKEQVNNIYARDIAWVKDKYLLVGHKKAYVLNPELK